MAAISTSTSTSGIPAQTLAVMSEIISYPILLQHEESFTQQNNDNDNFNGTLASSSAAASNSALLYDVSSWMLYISEIDSILEQLNDIFHSILAKSKHDEIKNMKNKKGTKGSFKTLLQNSRITDTITIGGGKTIPKTLSSISQCIDKLQKGRNLISERATSLLPGSYKLWKNYLDFRNYVFVSSKKDLFMEVQKCNYELEQLGHGNATGTGAGADNATQPGTELALSTSYQIASSSKSYKYKSTISAYERSLVRMNKYPKIWLSYIYFVITNDPDNIDDQTLDLGTGTSTGTGTGSTNHISTVRRLFNRALLSLPLTQHDLIWNEYLCWILNAIPPKGLLVQKGKNVDGPLIQYCKKNGGVLYRDNDGDDDNSNSNNNLGNHVPPETVLRVLRRYAHYYNPPARELLANKAIEYKNYGEGATLYMDILNDVNFLSVYGTTRHELWMKLTNVCTDHPEEIFSAGIDFEGIIRAVLKPKRYNNAIGGAGGTSNGSSGFGWDIFDKSANTRKNKDEQNDEENKENDEKKEKILEQRNQLQASLGEMEGTLWTKLAQYHITLGEFELARSIYEEAMESVIRVRDFSLIFDGYIQFEEGVIEAMMEMMNEEEEEDEEKDGDNGAGNTHEETLNKEDEEDLDILLGDSAVKHKKSSNSGNDEDEDENISADIELAMARAENIMSRRPLLLNYVLLRQNPHNVGEWLRRAELYMKLNQTSQAIASLEESFKMVHSKHAVNGSPAELYKTLANIYEEKLNDVDKARTVYERICCQTPEFQFREPDHLAQCYTSWVELELRLEKWDDALSIARRSVAHVSAGSSTKVTRGLSRSLRLWNLLLDLEESLGTLQTTKNSYNRLIELKVATPAHIMNFASYLIEKKYFEESFTAYERGLDMFTFPHPGAKILWKDYLQAFQTRYSGTKIHRMRELFDRCLESCPPEDASEFFILYGKFEEEFGLTKRALGVYERMCTVVPAEEKFNSYQLYIAKTIKYLGITATRPIYENAISALEDNAAAQICCEFAKLEASLQEIDRARTAFTYGAQMADPRRNPEYWGEWHSFEVSHGNEETFREMLRVKRGVQAAFSTVNYNAAEMGAGVPQQESLTNEEAMKMIAAREGIDTDEKEHISGFVQGKRTAEVKDLDEVERRAAKLRKVTSTFVAATANNKNESEYDEEIDIDDEDEDDDETTEQNEAEACVHNVKTKAVPSAVFGGLATQVKETSA